MAWNGRLTGHRFAGSTAWWHLPVYAPGEYADDPLNNRTDRDGCTLRPARLHIKHAMDGARQAELVGLDLIPHDRHEARSVRSGRNPTDGRVVRLYAWSARAGEAVGIRRIVVRYTTSSREGREATDTTTRTDRDGCTLYVPSVGIRTAQDSARNADLGTRSTDRDRHGIVLAATGDGMVHRLALDGGGRAGTALGVRRIVVRYSVVPRESRLSTDTTTRSDAEGCTLYVPTLSMRHAADSARQADLGAPSSDRDRFATMHGIGKVAAVHRLLVAGDGRAGTALGIRRIKMRYSVISEDRRQVAT